MCGIAGYFKTSDNCVLNPSELQSARKLLYHRGPDQYGEVHTPHAYLLNTRLKVQDFSSKADLPFVLKKYNIHIAYNGEVTNFRELSLKYNLHSKYGLDSKSDSEVIALMYLEKGIDFIKELNGMYSIAIVDETAGKGHLVRDCFGITPLYYSFIDGAILFASELKVLRTWRASSFSVNRQAIFDIFTFGYIPGIQTPYNEISELDKGSLLTIDFNTGRHILSRYHSLLYRTDFGMTEESAIADTQKLLSAAVERNLISDAPVGMTLSGGVDTSSILSIIHQLKQSHGLHTFSIKVNESSFDESRYQQLMSKRTGSTHHEILFSHEDILKYFYIHVAHLDEPISNGAALPSFVLSKHAAGFVKVLLSGEGGDEIFNAYDTHLAFKIRKLYLKAPKVFRYLIKNFVHLLPTNHSKLSLDFKAKRFTEGCELSTPASHLYWRHGFQESQIRRLFLGSSDLRSSYQYYEQLYADNHQQDDFNTISFLDLDQYLYGDLMVKNDRMIMAHSVESRFPLLDKDLVEFLATVPPSMRMDGLRPRSLQKKAMAHLLPQEIISRGSFGLELPHSKWLLGPLRPLLNQLLSKESINKAGLFDYQEVQKIIIEHETCKIDHGRGLWTILMCQAWHQMFVQSDNYRSYLNAQ